MKKILRVAAVLAVPFALYGLVSLAILVDAASQDY